MKKSIADKLRDLADKLDEEEEGTEDPDAQDETLAAFAWLAEVDIETFDSVFYRDNNEDILVVASRLLEFVLNDTSKINDKDIMADGFLRAFEWLLPETVNKQDEARYREAAIKRGEGEAYARRRLENMQYARHRLEEQLAHVDAFAESVKDVARSLRSVRRNFRKKGLL